MNSRKALLIENDESYLRLISGALAKFGFKSIVVREGGRAPEFVKQKLPGLIILAVELPGVNGYIVCKRIKETEETKGIPLILISSEAKPEDFEMHRKLRIRADEYMLKPFNQEDLLRKVETLIDLSSMKEEQPRQAGRIPTEQRIVSEDKGRLESREMTAFKQILDKVKLQNTMAVERLRGKLKEKTESEERLSKMLAVERENFQREKVLSETKLLMEIEQLREEKERLKMKIPELEAALPKAEEAKEIKKKLDQTLAERDELWQQYQTAMEEKSSLDEDLKKEREEKGSLISTLQREVEVLQENLREHGEKVTEAGGLIEKSKESEAELIRKTEGLEAQLATGKKREEELEKEIGPLREGKGGLISKNEALQREIEVLQERLREREGRVVEAEGLIKESKGFEAELIHKTEELEAQLAASKEREEELEKEIGPLREEKGGLISKNEALQGEIEDLQERVREREEKVVEAGGIIEEPKELEPELIRKTEELEAQLATGRKREKELEKEISLLREEKEHLKEEVPEAKEILPEIVPMERLEVEEKAKRSPFQLSIIGGGVAVLVFSLIALYFFISPDRSPSRLTPEPTPVVSVPPMSEKAVEKTESGPREEEKEEITKEAPETTEEKEEVTTAKAEPKPPIKKKEAKATKKVPALKPKTKPTAKAAKKKVLRYTVQVGAYTDKAELAKATESLKKLGIEPYTVTQRKKKKLYEVYLNRKFILGEANSISMKLNIFEIENKVIKQKGGRYSIFGGSFSSLKEAEEAKQRISDAGYLATVTPKSSTQPLYISRTGKFSAKKEADRVANTLKKSGFRPEIVELKK